MNAVLLFQKIKTIFTIIIRADCKFLKSQNYSNYPTVYIRFSWLYVTLYLAFISMYSGQLKLNWYLSLSSLKCVHIFLSTVWLSIIIFNCLTETIYCNKYGAVANTFKFKFTKTFIILSNNTLFKDSFVI